MTLSTTSNPAHRALTLPRRGRTVRENIELATLAERAGWQGFWVAEATSGDAVATAAAVAARLESSRVGTAILPMQTRNPLLLAMAATSISQVAPGGFVLGLGTSTPLIIEDWHATPWGSSPLQLTRECVALVRRFLAGERVTTDAGRWRYRRAQLAARPAGKIPVYLAALNDRMLELAGEIADGVVLNFVTTADVAHAKRRVAAGAARAGRNLADFEFMVFFRATVTDDYEAVRERYQRELFTYVMAPVYQRMFAREGYGDACQEIQSVMACRGAPARSQQHSAGADPGTYTHRNRVGNPGAAARLCGRRSRLDDHVPRGNSRP